MEDTAQIRSSNIHSTLIYTILMTELDNTIEHTLYVLHELIGL